MARQDYTYGTASVPKPPDVVNPPPSVTTNPGYTPNYPGIIQNDPGYLAARNAAQLAERNASAMRRQQLRDAIIRYGGIGSFKDVYGDLDPSTLDLASKNSNSILAQMASNYGLSEHQFRAQLAARGALQSGELGYGQDQLDKSYAQQRYDAANNLGTDTANALNSYTGVLSQNAQSLAQALAQAEASSISNPLYQPRGATYANYDAGLSAKYGHPVYTDDSGNLYDGTGASWKPNDPYYNQGEGTGGPYSL